MNSIDLSPGAFALPEPEATAEEKATQLPTPQGWKILCAVPEVDQKIAGTSLDLVRDTASLRQEEHASTVLFVMKVGADAYKDTVKFPTGPWCKEGDFVLVRTYTGTRFKIFGKEFRLINDDQVDAVVQDPRGLSRA